MKVQLKIEAGAVEGESVCSAFTADGNRVACTVSVFIGQKVSKVYSATNAPKARLAFAQIVRVVADRESWAGGDNTVSGELEKWATKTLDNGKESNN